MRKTNRNTKKTKIMRTISFASALMIAFALVGCGDISGSETDTTAESNSATEEYATEESESEPVCWIMETEKEKALALQEYTSNALLELASAKNEEGTEETEIDGGIDGEETEEVSEEDATVSDTSSSGSSSSSSGSSGSSSSSGSSNNSSTSSGSSGSSSSSSGSSSSSHKHSYTSKVTKQATCSSTGTITYTCSCGDSYTEEIAKTDHTWVEYTYTEEVYHPAVWADKYSCRNCGALFDTADEAAEHISTVHAGQIASWGNGTVKIQDAYDEEVTKTGYKCSVCGATK